MATKIEVEALKKNWFADPIWDLADTEGFEEHRAELEQFEKESQAQWDEEAKQQNEELERQAQKLGLVGLYKLYLKQQQELEELRSKEENR